MKRILIATVLCWSGFATAQLTSSSGSGGGGGKSGAHNFSVLGGMSTGGFRLGGAYEYMYDGSTGIGGHIHNFSKKTPTTSSPTAANGYMIIGAGLGHHFFKGKWDLAFTPSFNIIMIDSYQVRPDDTTTMGPGMSLSLVWGLTDRIGMGFDVSQYWVWFNEDFRGQIISDFALKLKASF